MTEPLNLACEWMYHRALQCCQFAIPRFLNTIENYTVNDYLVINPILRLLSASSA